MLRRVVVAPDSFKGCLSAMQVAEAIAAGLPGVDVVLVPMADGGEGTVQALADEIVTTRVTGPLGEPVTAQWGTVGDTGVIEMAQAAGLPLVPDSHRDPLATTSRGVGELIKAVWERGLRRCILGLGGSATIDGGIGLLSALGARCLDKAGEPVPKTGEGLVRLASIDLKELDPRVAETTFIAAYDVASTLAEAILYAPQKGATERELPMLREALSRFGALVGEVAILPGSGAAGGMGAGVAACLGATLQPGVELVAGEVGLAEKMRGADLVITGEGEINAQTAHGKTPAGVARIAKEMAIPVIGLAGRIESGWEGCGLDAAFSIAPGPISLGESLERAAELLTTTTYQLRNIL